MTARLRRRAGQARKALRLLADPVFRRGLRHGVGAAIEHRTVLAPLALRTVVDVGAHTGQFSLLVRALHPAARIVAFEPLPEAAARFRRVFAGDRNANLHRVAIGPCRGRVTMHVSAAADSSSLLPITALQARRFPGTAERGTVEVDAGPLRAFLGPGDLVPPALLKIDVQGYELEVLRASRERLEAFEHVYVEASYEELYAGQALAGEVAAFLDAHGFGEAGRFNLVRSPDGAPVQADFLFQRGSGSGAGSGSGSGSGTGSGSGSGAG